MPKEQLEEVSSRSHSLQYLLKVPMIMLIFLAAITSGTSVLLLKISDTILQKGELMKGIWELIFIGSLVVFTGDT